jgi:hypothetical protein
MIRCDATESLVRLQRLGEVSEASEAITTKLEANYGNAGTRSVQLLHAGLRIAARVCHSRGCIPMHRLFAGCATRRIVLCTAD